METKDIWEKKVCFGPAGKVLSSLSGDYSPAESTTDWLRGNLGIFSSRKWVSLQKDILFTCRSHLRHYQRLWFVFLWPDGFVSDVPASIIKLLQNWISIFSLLSFCNNKLPLALFSCFGACSWILLYFAVVMKHTHDYNYVAGRGSLDATWEYAPTTRL